MSQIIKYMLNTKTISKNVRKKILISSFRAKSAHIASSLSIVDLITVIYCKDLKKNKKNIFILSKGHACLAHYCLLNELKIISDKILNTYGENDTILMSHSSHKVPGVLFSTGSLGHGLPVSVGIALSNKIKKNKNKTFVVLSDGELNEGSNWEALLFASHHKLDNLVIIIDYNKIQSLDFVKKTLILEPLKNKFLSFGLKVKIIDGHNHSMISKSLKTKTSKPLVIIANTTKGKGIKFMENKVLWHYKSPNQKEVLDGLKQIGK